MSEPTSLPEWDKNATHTTALAATHKDDGWATNEVPASDELNEYMRLTYRWIQFFKSERRLTSEQLQRRLIPQLNTLSDPGLTGLYDLTTCPYAIAVASGGAYPKQGSANNKLGITPGTLLQFVGGQMLAYTFDGTEEVTIANGATNPRVDIIQMKLTYVESSTPSVTLTLSVKQGATAVSPTYPTADAGYVVIAGVVVNTTWPGGGASLSVEDGAGAHATIHDQRVPLCARAHHVRPKDFLYTSTQWTVVSNGSLLQANAGGAGELLVVCPTGGGVGRLVHAAAGFWDPAVLTSNVAKYALVDAGGGTGTNVVITNLNDTYMNGAGGSTFSRRSAAMENMIHTPAAGPTVLANAAGVGAPMWTNGKRALDDFFGIGPPTPFEALCLRYVTNPEGLELGPITFWIAGGY